MREGFLQWEWYYGGPWMVEFAGGRIEAVVVCGS